VVGTALAVAACGGNSGSGGASESGGGSGASPKTGTVTFWSSNGLTGGSAFYGKGSLMAQQLLMKQVNDQGGIKTSCGQTYKIALKTWDDANTPAQAVAGMQKAGPDKSILGMIASTSDTAWLPEVPVAGQIKIPMIVPSDGSTVPAQRWNEWSFRVFGSEETTFELSIKALEKATHLTRIAVIYDNTNQSQSGDAQLWKKFAPSIGAKVVAYQSFSPNDKNFQAQLTAAAAQHPDFLVLDGQEPSGLYNQAKQLGLIPKVPAYSFAGINNTAQEWKLTNGAVNGSYDFSPTAIGPNVDLHDPAAVSLYKDKAGVYPNTFQLAGWDALAVAIDAVKRSCTNSDRQKFRDALAQTKDFPLSTQGTVTWKNPPTGENVSPSAIVTKVTGPGEFTVVK
jgi:branched-chain amino acid transport system substrate-binding protein